MRRLILFLLMLGVLGAEAQESTLTPEQKFQQANIHFNNQTWFLALPLYLDLCRENPQSAFLHYKAGICLLNTPSRKEESLAYFEKATQKTTEKTINEFDLNQQDAPYKTWYWYGRALHINYRTDEAIKAFEKYLSVSLPEQENALTKQAISQCRTTKKYMENPVKAEIINLGPSVNTAEAEYAPVISADEATLIFTSKRAGTTGGQKNRDGKYFEDIYMSYRTGGGWSMAQAAGKNINTPYNDGSVGLSSDGQKLLIYRDNSEGGNVYISQMKGGEWGKPEKLGGDINSKAWEPSAAFSADGNTIYFVSDRKGGFGGRDIYYCKKNAGGKWTDAINMGSTINTPYDEDAPFVSLDGKTIYFSSNAPSAMGGFDIFQSKYDAANKKWLQPENLGYPINTPEDDVFFVTSPDEKRAFYSSVRPEGFGEKDIYVIVFPEKESKALVVYRGRVMYRDGGIPDDVEVVVEYPGSTDPAMVYNIRHDNGTFLFTVETDREYTMSYRRKNQMLFSEKLRPETSKTYKEVMLNPFILEREKARKGGDKNKKATAAVSGEQKPKTDTVAAGPVDLRSGIVTRPVNYYTKSPLYGVQVGAFTRSIPDGHFRNLKNVHSFIDTLNVIRYVVGNCVTRQHAEAIRKHVMEAGYKDAFIVDINQASKFTEEVMSSGKKPLTGKVEYRIQVGVFKDRLPEDLAKNYLKVDEIEQKNENENTYLMVGKFGEYKEAEEYLADKVKPQIADAFIVAYLNGKRISLKEANEVHPSK